MNIDKTDRHLAQLRHLYELMVNGKITDQRCAADGLLSPAIAHFETLTDKYTNAIADELAQHLSLILKPYDAFGNFGGEDYGLPKEFIAHSRVALARYDAAKKGTK